MILIDCGGMVFHRLMEQGRLDGVERLRIVVTHLHPDHAGSLGEVIFHSHFLKGFQPTVHFSEERLMSGFLKAVGVSPEMAVLACGDRFELSDPEFGAFSIAFLPSSHVDTIPAWSILLRMAGETIFYSGDSNDIRPDVLEMLVDGRIDRFYQDTCGIDYEGNAHMSLSRLAAKVPAPLRGKVWCMHLDQHVQVDEIRRLGFRVAGESD